MLGVGLREVTPLCSTSDGFQGIYDSISRHEVADPFEDVPGAIREIP